MHEINKVLKVAAFRLGVSNFLLGLSFALMLGIGALIALRITQQIVGFSLPWKETVLGVGGFALLAGLGYSLFARPKPVAVARRVDEGANLRESLSTALCVMGQKDDPWARATIESAAQRARGVRVAQAVPIQPPRFWPIPLAMALGLTTLYFMPRVDLFGLQEKKVAKQEQQREIIAAKNQVQEVERKIEQMKEELGIEKNPTEPVAGDKPQPQNPDEIRKSAIKEMTKLSDRLEQLKSGEKSQALKQVQNKLKHLQAPGKETTDLAKALAAGQFAAAAKEVEKLKQEMSSGNMNASEKQELAKQLLDMSEQLEQLAREKEELKQAMQKAGLDPALADASPEQMQQALQNASNLSAEQKQQLQQASEAMSQSQNAMSNLSNALQQMSQAAGSQDQQSSQQQAQQGSQSGQQQLSELEQMQQEMQQASAMQQELQDQMQQLASQCQGGGEGNQSGGSGQQPGDSNQWSDAFNESQNASGGGGRATGENFAGNRASATADFSTKKERSIGAMGKGRIIGSRLVEGDSIKGESTAEFSSAVATASQSATESMENNVIPREFHDAVKNYFGGLKQKSAPAKDAKSPAQPASSTPAPPSQDADGKK